jgi:fibronectin-binding autotransporter adhesin
MNNHNPLQSNNSMPTIFRRSSKISLLAGTLLLGGLLGATAANVTLKANDAAGTSSFTGSTNWNPAGVPLGGNSYFSTNFTIRTTNYAVNGGSVAVNFAGDSLSLDTGGRVLGKIGNNGTAGQASTGTYTANYILNGGAIEQASGTSGNDVLIIAGTVTVNAASFLGAIGATSDNSANFCTLEIVAPISGSANLQVSGQNLNGGADTGVVKLSAANPYSGTLTVPTSRSANAAIASAVNRMLQLNNLNALSNATLNLTSTNINQNVVSFTSVSNTGPFNVGALSGSSSQTLSDTAGNAITLSLGGKNTNTTYSGALTGAGNLVKTGSGTMTLTGTNTYTGTTTIESGSLQLGNGGAGGALSSGSTLAVDGNLTINRNNTATQGVDFSSSPITGAGSFAQAGAGTTILNAANSYGGVTTVGAGKLVISSAQTGTGAITVANGAKLGIIVSGLSQLPPSTLTLGTSAATTLEFDGLNSTTVAPINVGTLSLGGQVTVNINTGAFAAGNSYPLIHWTGSGPANASAFTLGVSPGLTAAFSVSGGTLYLNVTAVSDIWNGTLDGNWDTTTANWTGNATIFANGHSVLFDDAAAGTTSVTIAAPVQPAGMIFNNSLLPYTITAGGANKIGGTGGLTKINNGSLTLAGGVNDYTGATVINGGTLSVGTLANAGQASDIGAASTASANLVLNNGTLQYTGGSTSTDRGATMGANGGTVEVNVGGVDMMNSGVIAGAGVLTKTGDGTLTLSGASTFSGGLTLNAGQLNINNGGSSSANSAIGTGTLTLAAGTIDNTSGADVTLAPNNPQAWSGDFTYVGSAHSLNLGTGPVALSASRIVTVSANTLTVGGVISGAFGLTKLGAGALALSGANTYGNNGAFDSAINGGVVIIGNDSAFGSSRLNLADGVTLQSSDSSARVITNNLNFGSGAGGNNIFAGTGNLKFTGSAANGTAKTLTVNNPQTEFSGVLSGALARTVAGTGVLIFSGANTYSLGTTINPAATLQLGNGGTTGSLSTSGALVNDGTLRFNRSDALVQGTHFSASPITGSGAVVQAGSGTTTLTAANEYTGLTMVSNGALFLTPAYQAAGEVIVANNAKFGVSATSVSNSATIGNLTLGSGGATTLDFSYGFVGNPTNAALIANTITINGSSAVRVGGTFAVGTFPVAKYNSLSGAFAGAVVGPRGVTATFSNDVINKVLYVTVSSVGSGIVWTGTNSVSPNLWDLNTTTNWLIGGSPTVYIENVPPGDAVTFNDSGSSLVLLSNAASPANVTISNAFSGYVFQGTGSINSSAGLSKTGAGSLTLNVPGTFATSTLLTGGAVSIGANQTMANLSGSSAVTVSTNAPTLTVNSSSNTTYSGNASGALTLNKTGTGVFTMTGSNNFTGNLFVKAGAVTLDSGFINANNFSSIGQNGSDNGTLTLKGTASATVNNDFNVGDVGASVGVLTVQDTASLTISSFFIGSANAASSTATGTVYQTGGSVTQLATGAGSFCVGGRAETTSVGGAGVYHLSGGTLIAGGGIRVGSAGSGTFNQSGGIVNANGDLNIARFANSSGTYNLDGGTLRAPRVISSTGVNATFNFNGGVLMATGDNTGFVTGMSQINVRNGGAIVDTADFNVTIGQALPHSSIGGDNAVDGGLTKRGTGALTLADAFSSYTGPTFVSAGTLNVSPNSITSLNDVTVSNATLGLNVSGGVASVNAASLKLAGTSALNLNYDVLPGAPAPAFNVSGSLTVSGLTTLNVLGYGWTVGQVALVDYSGTPLASLGNFALGALPYGVTASLSNNTANTSIDLVITAVGAVNWIPLVASDPFGSSSFNSALNWQDFNAPVGGNGYFTRAFTLRSPADTSPYSFGGDILAVDAGGQLLLKGTDGQVVTIGNLLLNGGLVVFGVSTTDNFTETLAGAVTLHSGLTSTMAANGSAGNAETLNVTASISGAGNLRINGAGGNLGTIVLATNNTYTGTTTVAAGTLVVNGANGNSVITVNSNGTLCGLGSISGAVNVQAGGNLAPGIPARGALVTAIGTLTAGNTSVGGGVLMKIDRASVPTSDKLVAPSVVVNPGASLTLNNLGSTNFVVGDTFTLFSAPISGAFSTVNLPPLPQSSMYWTNKLALNGTIAVASASVSPATLTNTLAGNTLSLSWPAGQGWVLQSQTNALNKGLGTNWVSVPGSTSISSTNITVNKLTPATFYRLMQ